MDYKKRIIEMENNKRDLVLIINSIQNPKMVKYILGFVRSFIELRN